MVKQMENFHAVQLFHQEAVPSGQAGLCIKELCFKEFRVISRLTLHPMQFLVHLRHFIEVPNKKFYVGQKKHFFFHILHFELRVEVLMLFSIWLRTG